MFLAAFTAFPVWQNLMTDAKLFGTALQWEINSNIVH